MCVCVCVCVCLCVCLMNMYVYESTHALRSTHYFIYDGTAHKSMHASINLYIVIRSYQTISFSYLVNGVR